MRDLPTGTVTLLFTDIEGSTRLLQQAGERYASVLDTCRSLLRARFRAYGGHEVDTQGDAFFVAFARASDGVAAASAAQRALASHAWPDGLLIRVRMGLHTGEPVLASEGYVGLDVHRAARIMSAAHGGQVLLSEATRALVQDALPQDVLVRDLGDHRLKDLGPPTRLYQLVIAGLPADFPPPRTLDRTRNNLPLQPTPFIGREKEVAAVQQHLVRQDRPLLTLTGPGGVGKTRLALQVAAEVSEHFPDGTWFVSLAPLRDPELVLPTISQTLALREERGQSVLDQLKAHLREQQVLLVLDNFEQVIGAAVPIADLLTACPRLKVLVTSREALHLQAEQEFAVPALALPDPRQLPDLATLSQYEAVALFIERAQAVQPDFQVTNSTAPSVAEICTRLDGLPLAIELAAARLPLFPPQALLARLSQRLQLLTSSRRDAPARQQTLRHTLQWSYDLLSASEQQLFWRLAVFVGGCTFAAVESVAVALGDDASSVLDGVASLLDKNLLQQTEHEGAEPRLRLLETIREFGQERLEAAGELAAMRDAHAVYYLALAEKAAAELEGPQQAVWLERLEREHDNLRATLEWALAQAKEERGLELALRLGEALAGFWYVRGYWSEGRTFLEAVLTRSSEAVPALRARVLSADADFAYAQGANERAEALCQESLALFRTLDDKRGIASCLYVLAVIAERQGTHYSAIRALYEESLALSRELGDQQLIAQVLSLIADAVSILGAYREGQVLFEEALALHRIQGNTHGVAFCLRQSALWLLLEQGAQPTVHARLEETLRLYRETGDKEGMAYHACIAGQAAYVAGDLGTAQALEEQSLALCAELEERWLPMVAHAFLGRIAAKQGNFAAARTLHEASLQAGRAFAAHWITAFGLEGLAETVVAQGAGAWTAHLLGAAEVVRERCGMTLPPVERADYEAALAATRHHLGTQAFARAWTEGRAMTLNQALAAEHLEV